MKWPPEDPARRGVGEVCHVEGPPQQVQAVLLQPRLRPNVEVPDMVMGVDDCAATSIGYRPWSSHARNLTVRKVSCLDRKKALESVGSGMLTLRADARSEHYGGTTC